MTAAMGYTELVQYRLKDQPDLFKMLTTIAQSTQQAGDLAQQMLAFAQGGKYQPQPLNLNNTVREVLDLQERTLPAGIQIEPDLAPDLHAVEADPTQMSQIVLNLLTNAVEAIEDEGKITIVTKQVTVDKNCDKTLPNLAEGQYICLLMTDTGHGMNSETLTRVFEPFFTTKFQGRGMGLAATYGIVENHHGHIAFTSQPGEGTTCRVYLPAIQPKTDPKKQ
jgi:signal transduction histidine kinase